jgi:hypothetical protein
MKETSTCKPVVLKWSDFVPRGQLVISGEVLDGWRASSVKARSAAQHHTTHRAPLPQQRITQPHTEEREVEDAGPRLRVKMKRRGSLTCLSVCFKH